MPIFHNTLPDRLLRTAPNFSASPVPRFPASPVSGVPTSPVSGSSPSPGLPLPASPIPAFPLLRFRLFRVMISSCGFMQATIEQPKTAREGENCHKRLERAYKFADLGFYPAKKRLLIRLADVVFYALIRIVGHTTSFRVEGEEHWVRASGNG